MGDMSGQRDWFLDNQTGSMEIFVNAATQNMDWDFNWGSGRYWVGDWHVYQLDFRFSPTHARSPGKPGI
jgi:hypothetical protein